MIELNKGEYSGNVIGFREMDGFICTETIYNHDNFNSNRHCHENTHLSMALSGGVMERKKASYVQLPGSITFYHSGEYHAVENVEGYSRHFKLEIEESLLKRNNLSEGDLYTYLKRAPDIHFLMPKMYQEIKTADIFSKTSIEIIVNGLLFSRQLRISNLYKPNWIDKIEEFLKTELTDVQISLEELSYIGNIHPVTISKYFSKFFGCTFGEYQRKLRIQKALQLLRDQPELSLTEIALQCGFSDQSHFIRVFKLYMGELPSRFKHHLIP